MVVDLTQLKEMHPKLTGAQVSNLVERGTLALQRNSHKPGVSVSLDLDGEPLSGFLYWTLVDMRNIHQHDYNRITEDGAEGVALALAHQYLAWRVVRRMQRGEHADWLLENTHSGKPESVALEVSGVDRGSVKARLREKLTQVGKIANVNRRCACVVGFEEPAAALRFAGELPHGN